MGGADVPGGNVDCTDRNISLEKRTNGTAGKVHRLHECSVQLSETDVSCSVQKYLWIGAVSHAQA